MQNQKQFVRQTAAVLIAVGLIVGLLPGRAAAQDMSTFEARKQWALELLAEGDFSAHSHGSARRLAKLYLSDGKDSAPREYLVVMLEDMQERALSGHGRHAGPETIWALYKFGHHFSADQLERIKKVVTSKAFRYQGTERYSP